MFKVDLLSGEGLYDVYKDERIYDRDLGNYIRPVFKDLDFLKYDELFPGFSPRDIQRHALYLCVFKDTVLVGVRKFYEIPERKQEINQILRDMKFPSIKGQVWTSGYISVREGFKRQGIGSLMNDLVLDLMTSGDIFIFGIHKQDGIKLDRSWLSKNKNRNNIIYDYYELNMYDPGMKNFIVRDEGSLGRISFQIKKLSNYMD